MSILQSSHNGSAEFTLHGWLGRLPRSQYLTNTICTVILQPEEKGNLVPRAFSLSQERNPGNEVE